MSESGVVELLDGVAKDDTSSEIEQLIETTVNNLRSKVR